MECPLPDTQGKDDVQVLNKFDAIEFVCRPYAFLSYLCDNFGVKFMCMLFAVQHVMKGFVYYVLYYATLYVLAAYNVTGSELTIYVGVVSLPWSIKPLMGIVSDAFPIWGYSRGPQMMLYCVVGLISLICVGFNFSWLTVHVVVLFLVLQNVMLSGIDILSEAKYANMIKRCPKAGPDLIAYVWFGIQTGNLVAVNVAGVAMTDWSIYTPFLISIVPTIFTMILLAFNFMEEQPMNNEEIRKVREVLCAEKEAGILCACMVVACVILFFVGIWVDSVYAVALVSLTVVICIIALFKMLLSPIIAGVVVYSILQTVLTMDLTGASYYFYTDSASEYPDGPHFSTEFYTCVMGSIAAVFSLVGIVIYNRWWKQWRYRKLFMVTQVIVSVCYLLDCIMFSRLNVTLGIPDWLFVLGSKSLENTVYMWQYLPSIVLIAQLCPDNMEGTLYALLAGSMNMGGTIAYNFGSLLLYIFGVEPTGADDEGSEFTYLWVCSAIASCLPMITIAMIPYFIPDASQSDVLLDPNDCSATNGSLWKQWMGARTIAGGVEHSGCEDSLTDPLQVSNEST